MEIPLFQALYPYLTNSIDDWNLIDLHKLVCVSREWRDAYGSKVNKVREELLLVQADKAIPIIDMQLITLLHQNFLKHGIDGCLQYAERNAQRLFGMQKTLDESQVCLMFRFLLNKNDEDIKSGTSNGFWTIMTVLCVKHHFRFTPCLYYNRPFKQAVLQCCIRIRDQSHMLKINDWKVITTFMDKTYRSIKYTGFKG